MWTLRLCLCMLTILCLMHYFISYALGIGYYLNSMSYACGQLFVILCGLNYDQFKLFCEWLIEE
jgi:hypothetical protein